MKNFNILEELRTKEELVNYFEERGQSITEEEIKALKKSYEQIEENNNFLNIEQLDDIVWGQIDAKIVRFNSATSHIQALRNALPGVNFRQLNELITITTDENAGQTEIYAAIPRLNLDRRDGNYFLRIAQNHEFENQGINIEGELYEINNSTLRTTVCDISNMVVRSYLMQVQQGDMTLNRILVENPEVMTAACYYSIEELRTLLETNILITAMLVHEVGILN